MTGDQITVVITTAGGLAGAAGIVWRGGQTVAKLHAAIERIDQSLAALVRIDVDHEDRIRDLERDAWSTATGQRRRGSDRR